MIARRARRRRHQSEIALNILMRPTDTKQTIACAPNLNPERSRAAAGSRVGRFIGDYSQSKGSYRGI